MPIKANGITWAAALFFHVFFYGSVGKKCDGRMVSRMGRVGRRSNEGVVPKYNGTIIMEAPEA